MLENQNNNNNNNKGKGKRIYMKRTFSQKAADIASRGIGSWKFIFVQSIIIIAWILLNIYGYVNHWDPYPFIFLNLSLSLFSAYTAPVILMSQNREAERDRARAINDLATDRKAEREIQDIQSIVKRLERKIDEMRRS